MCQFILRCHFPRPEETCLLVAVRRPIGDMNCFAVRCFYFQRVPIFEFRVAHLSGVGLTSPSFR